MQHYNTAQHNIVLHHATQHKGGPELRPPYRGGQLLPRHRCATHYTQHARRHILPFCITRMQGIPAIAIW